MEELIHLFTQYTITDIIIFIAAIAAAVKGVVSFYDWALERINKRLGKENEKAKAKNEILNEIRNMHNTLNGVVKSQEDITQRVQNMADVVDTLIDSDKDDIKAWITEKHHHFVYRIGHIDDYSLDCIEKRYKHYKDEGGNSFIATLMEELRHLPKVSHVDSENDDIKE